MKLSRSQNGFSLIELLAAAAITVVIAGIMLGLVINTTSAWQRASGKLQAANQARTILDYLTRDLQSAILRRDGNVWLAATIQHPQSTLSGDSGMPDAAWTERAKPSSAESLRIPLSEPEAVDLDQYRFGQAGVWLRLFCETPDNSPDRIDDDGDNDLTEVLLSRVTAPRAVAYQIVRRPAGIGGREYRYQLMRSEVMPMHSDTEIRTRTTFDVGFDLFGVNGYNDVSVGGVAAGNAGTLRRPLPAHLIGNGVVDFGVRIWCRNDAGELVVRFPMHVENLGFAATARATNNPTAVPPNPAGRISVGHMTYGFPEEIEVFVRILTSEGERQLALIEDPPAGATPSGNWWDIVEQHSRIFTRRILLHHGAL